MSTKTSYNKKTGKIKQPVEKQVYSPLALGSTEVSLCVDIELGPSQLTSTD